MKYSDFFTEKGRINSVKVRETWLMTHASSFLQKVDDYLNLHKIETTRTVEKLWYFFNKVDSQVVCKNSNCTNTTAFKTLDRGFSDYCSSKCSNSSEQVKEEKAKACLTKFGVVNPFQSKEIIRKIEETNLSRFGTKNVMRSVLIKNKMIENSMHRNGTPWALSAGGKANRKKEENLRLAFEQKYSDLIILEYSKEKFGMCTLKQASCGHSFTINKWQLHQRRSQSVDVCTVCNPIGSFNETIWQSEISDMLRELGISFIEKDRKTLSGLELDFYIPESNLAIELDGLYWHSVTFKQPKYHLTKTERCEALGIQLIHIFEDEWKFKKEIVKSRLASLLGKSSRKIFARKCEVRKITEKESSLFINENHIQGNVIASKRLGLFYGEELISVMTFGALRRALGSTPKNGEYEMYRFCNKKGTQVVGGASKLLKRFILDEKPTQITSYADRRWSVGKLYEALGFTKVKKTDPNFWYVDGDRRLHRFAYTKKKLSEKLGSDGRKEDQIAKLGLNIIFDSGNLKFQLYPKAVDQ